MDKLAELIARSEIHDCLLRYARGVDRKDWNLVRGAYHRDATDEHGEFVGGIDGFIEWVSARHAAIPFSMHLMINCLIEFANADTAVVETCFVTLQRRNGDDGLELETEVVGRYVDRFERREGEWRIARRRVVYDSSSSRPSTFVARKSGVLGTRDQSDAIFQLRREAGLL